MFLTVLLNLSFILLFLRSLATPSMVLFLKILPISLYRMYAVMVIMRIGRWWWWWWTMIQRLSDHSYAKEGNDGTRRQQKAGRVINYCILFPSSLPLFFFHQLFTFKSWIVQNFWSWCHGWWYWSVLTLLMANESFLVVAIVVALLFSWKVLTRCSCPNPQE